MATPYDDTFKIFISENAQDFLSWLVKGAQLHDLNKGRSDTRNSR
jgi:hypothetical protein